MFREHGPPGPAHVVVLHGGPGAPGDAGGLAHLLADPLRVLEPFQRGSSDVPLTVAQHVEDLAAFVAEHVTGAPRLVGHSWGAILALEYAIDHPVRSLLLVCSGTFDVTARAAFLRDRDNPYVLDPLPPDPLPPPPSPAAPTPLPSIAASASNVSFFGFSAGCAAAGMAGAGSGFAPAGVSLRSCCGTP